MVFYVHDCLTFFQKKKYPNDNVLKDIYFWRFPTMFEPYFNI